MFNSVQFNEDLFVPGVVGATPWSAAFARAYAPILIVAVLVSTDAATAMAAGVTPASIMPPIITPDAATATAEGRTPQHVIILYHAVKRALYKEMPTKPNRIYVIGMDNDGNTVFGEAKNSTDISLYGERLITIPEDMVIDRTTAETVADNILDNVRLQVDRGMMLIPPNCGVEVWDVVTVQDSMCNQENGTYRIAGWQFQYDPRAAVYQHIVRLTSV